ncbi:hypothetical protein [Streptomyces albogriseolus]
MLNYCTDESKASTRNLRTGVVEGPRHGPTARSPRPDMTVQETRSVNR